MPPEPAGPACVYVRGHGPRPVGPAYAGKPAHHGVHDVWKPVTALQCIAAVARGPRHLGQLAASLTMYGWQVIRVARHLAGLAQAASYLFSFFFIHITLSHKSIGLSSRLFACGLWLAPRRLRFSRRWIQYPWTVPRTLWSGAPGLRVKDVLHHLEVLISGWDHEAGCANNVCIFTPVRDQLFFSSLHPPIAQL